MFIPPIYGKCGDFFITSLHLQSIAPGLPVTPLFPPGANSDAAQFRRPIKRWGGGYASPFEKERCVDWIGLRENLQETIDFPIKYGAFL